MHRAKFHTPDWWTALFRHVLLTSRCLPSVLSRSTRTPVRGDSETIGGRASRAVVPYSSAQLHEKTFAPVHALLTVPVSALFLRDLRTSPSYTSNPQHLDEYYSCSAVFMHCLCQQLTCMACPYATDLLSMPEKGAAPSQCTDMLSWCRLSQRKAP